MFIQSLLALTSAEKWSTGGITALIGLGMTFVMLILLIGAILLLRLILNFLEKNNPKLKAKLSGLFKRKKTQEVTEPISDVENKHKNDLDEETKQILESAVKAYAHSSDDGKPHDRIKILSVKEVSHE